MARKNPRTTVQTASGWKGSYPISEFGKSFKVYPSLTAKFDRRDWKFSQPIVNEIMLWKVNRYAELPDSLLRELDELRKLKPGEHSKGNKVLAALLGLKGVRLPVASTFLRFANPDVFQIYDRHVCRALWGRWEDSAPKDAKVAVELYSRFLDELREQCERLQIAFSEADRVLFVFDKEVNPPLKMRLPRFDGQALGPKKGLNHDQEGSGRGNAPAF